MQRAPIEQGENHYVTARQQAPLKIKMGRDKAHDESCAQCKALKSLPSASAQERKGRGGPVIHNPLYNKGEREISC